MPRPANLAAQFVRQDDRGEKFSVWLQTLRQVEFALFDMRLHDQFDPHGTQSVQDILNQVREQISVFTAPEFNRFQHAFSHIFAGGYAAGYYSYKWAEVYLPMPMPRLKNTVKPRAAICHAQRDKSFRKKYWKLVAHARRLIHSKPSVAESPPSMLYYAIAACQPEGAHLETNNLRKAFPASALDVTGSASAGTAV
jgi:hypothetical protein